MKYLFRSKHNLLKDSMKAKSLLIFDLDGTLSPIVKDPNKATIPKSTKKLLELLSKQPNTDLVILTGRSSASAKKILGNLQCKIIGNHGLDASFINPMLKAKWIKRCSQITQILRRLFSEQHYFIENKKYSLSVHARPVDRKLLSIVSPLLNPEERIIYGKNVINIMPTDKVHKGTTILTLKKNYKSDYVLFVGDDYTDEDVFEIEDLAANLVTVRIGYKRKSKAQFYLREQIEIDKLLQKLINKD